MGFAFIFASAFGLWRMKIGSWIEKEMEMLKKGIGGCLLLILSEWLSGGMHAGNPVRLPAGNPLDTICLSRSLIHQIEAEFRPAYILPTNVFLKGENARRQLIRKAFSGHVKYAFRFRPYSYLDRIYGSPVQGAGVGWYTFSNRREIGDPLAFYLFQGARLATLHPRLTLRYEWNFGLSAGWHPYHTVENEYNRVIGSKLNAYLHTDFYFNWAFPSGVDLHAGIGLAHFSNGNTKFPNTGLNTAGIKVGVVYRFDSRRTSSPPAFLPPVPAFPRHISYDVVVFGSWRRKGFISGEDQFALPGAYSVWGFNFTPLYNFSYIFRAGLSLDGVYDSSANVYLGDYIVGTDPPVLKPSLRRQLALGLSARAELVMPYFTIALGVGRNVIHDGGDMRGWYQVLALKVELTRSSFLHIGYSLKDFHNPNFLMLGVGFRFHNLYPMFHR